MKTLYLDIGNTRSKWLFDNLGVETRGILTQEALEDKDVLRNLFPEVEKVAVSCVKGDDYLGRLKDSVMAAWGIGLCAASTRSSQLGLICAYDEPERLGVDRWLAMLAAWRIHNCPVCVVDCGSAVTIDLVASSGQHLGGYILPGLRIGVQGLLQGTDRVIVDFDKLQTATLELGQNTTEAVYHGALFSLNANVESAYRTLKGQQPDNNCVLVLTGGDGLLLSELTTLDYDLNEDLVLQGLKLYFDNQ